ncbi:oligosaccharide flippase family protein [bacterium]|nr:oligosaccharide flippase family protein [bacterium]
MFIPHTIVILVSRLSATAIGFISGILVARYLLPEGKGIMASLAVISGIAAMFANPGLAAANAHRCAVDKENARQVVMNSIVWGLGAGFFVVLVVLMIHAIQPGVFGDIDFSLLVVALLGVPAAAQAILFANVLIGLQRFVYYNVLEISIHLVGLLATILLLVILSKGVFELVTATTVFAWLTAFGYLAYFYRLKLLRGLPDFTLLKQSLSYGFFLWISSFFSYLVIRWDILVINYYLGADETGIYSLSVIAIDLLNLVPVAVGTVLFPRLSSLSLEEKDRTLPRVVHSFWPVILLISGALALIFPTLVRVLYGEAFLPSVPIFYVLLPGAMFLSVEILLANSLAARGEVKYIPVIWAIVLFVNVVLTVVMVKWYGAIGAGIASTISYTLVFFLMLALHRRRCANTLGELFIPRRDSFAMIFQDLSTIASSLRVSATRGPRRSA